MAIVHSLLCDLIYNYLAKFAASFVYVGSCLRLTITVNTRTMQQTLNFEHGLYNQLRIDITSCEL